LKKVIIAASTYAVHSTEPLKYLDQMNINVVKNLLSRKLTPKELVDLASGAQGIIAGTETYSFEVLDQLPQLKVISRLGVGMDNIELKATKDIGIKVFKTTTTPAPAVAELTMGLMLDIARKISQSNLDLRTGKWEKKMGSLIKEKTLGIIGLGTIGKALVELSSGFDFQILAFDQKKDKSFAEENDITYCDLNTLLKYSDIVTIHLNLSDQTKCLIDEEKVNLMKSGSILINTSRGEIIDEKSLYNALKEKRILGAGLDVFNDEPYSGPLTELENVVLTPHIGAYAKEIRVQMEIEAAQNLIKGLNDEQ
tara:strand:- start:404 stop:1333 length:930 start_codon:yes stop_codon:yes gene_type:complete